MSGIEIFIDESGDFGPYREHCPYYFVTMVFHEAAESLYSNIFDLEYRLSVLGLENHCIHSSPAIRGEDEYFGMDLAVRRKVISNFMAFVHSAAFRYKCFFAKKTTSGSGELLLEDLKGQKQISQLIYETLETRFQNIRVTKTLPIHSRLSQVADLVCTMNRIAHRLSETGALAKPESYFFGGEKNFRRNWLKSIRKSEWK